MHSVPVRVQEKSSGHLQWGTGLLDQRGASPVGASPTWLCKGRVLLAGPRCAAESHYNTAADGRRTLAGNYEKSLENSAAAVKEYTRGDTGNSYYRGISADIISGAYADVIDYTGTRARFCRARMRSRYSVFAGATATRLCCIAAPSALYRADF